MGIKNSLSDNGDADEREHDMLNFLQWAAPQLKQFDIVDRTAMPPSSSACMLPSRCLEIATGATISESEKDHVAQCDGCRRRLNQFFEECGATDEEAQRFMQSIRLEEAAAPTSSLATTEGERPISRRAQWFVAWATAALLLIAVSIYFDSHPPGTNSAPSQVIARALSGNQLGDFVQPSHRGGKSPLLRRGSSYHLSIAHPDPMQRQWLIRLTSSRAQVVAAAANDEKFDYNFDVENDWTDEDNRCEIFVIVTADDIPQEWKNADSLPFDISALYSTQDLEELAQMRDETEQNEKLTRVITEALDRLFESAVYKALVVWCESENRL